jgi:hypothetical protein
VFLKFPFIAAEAEVMQMTSAFLLNGFAPKFKAMQKPARSKGVFCLKNNTLTACGFPSYYFCAKIAEDFTLLA